MLKHKMVGAICSGKLGAVCSGKVGAILAGKVGAHYAEFPINLLSLLCKFRVY
jgi:hypothetical protein